MENHGLKTVRDICMYIGNTVAGPPVCVETGCTYGTTPDVLVHTTTNNLYYHVVRPNDGFLFSLDIDPEHIEIATTLLEPDGAHLYRFMEGDSVEQAEKLAALLKKSGRAVSVLCLDSKEFDEQHMVNEYLAIKPVLSNEHFILVDDIHNPNSVKYKKMVPLLKGLGYYSCIEVPTPTGMFVASTGYPLP